MSDVILRVNHLSKKYGFDNRPLIHSKNFKDDLIGFFRKKPPKEDGFFSLKDVSFEMKRGEALGIIGPNGAGKSTLLKILARVTAPTSGSAEVYGKIGALLEVGAGFHPDLTGRENIFLSGTILGMKRIEIQRRFEEIVDFSEIKAHLDRPVKHYSSGMYLRLAFSIMVHLEADFLLLDEVLAVGDAAFQKKCSEKIETLAKEGKTILFVSHQLEWVAKLCPRTILLQNGTVFKEGPTAEIINEYMHLLSSQEESSLRSF